MQAGSMYLLIIHNSLYISHFTLKFTIWIRVVHKMWSWKSRWLTQSCDQSHIKNRQGFNRIIVIAFCLFWPYHVDCAAFYGSILLWNHGLAYHVGVSRNMIFLVFCWFAFCLFQATPQKETENGLKIMEKQPGFFIYRILP